VAIILPGFLLVVLLSRWLERLRAWSWSARFLDAVNAAAIGLIVWLIRTMALSSLVDWQSWLIAALVALAILLWKAPLAFLVLGGGLAGLLLS
jgi:chromate transporter